MATNRSEASKKAAATRRTNAEAAARRQNNSHNLNWLWILFGILGLVLLGVLLYRSFFTPCITCTPTEPVAPPVIVDDDGSGEIRNWHQNPGSFELLPGEAANGGHIWVGDQEFLFVDDKVVVVTNNSSDPVIITSTDGVGVSNSTDYDLMVLIRFAEGCDPDGCSSVLWVNITDSGITTEVINK